MARCAASGIPSRPRCGWGWPLGPAARSPIRTIDSSLTARGTDGMNGLPKPAAEESARRPPYLLFCLVGGTLVLVLACWLWFTRVQELATLRGHRGMVRSLALSPDGALLASGGEDHQIRVWDAATYRLRLTLDGHTDTVNSVAFAPDNTLLASASADRTVRLWDSSTGREVATLTPSTQVVNSVAFSPDGEVLASAGADAKVYLWQVASRQPLRMLEGHRKSIRTVAFSPDGQTLASGGEDGTILLWDWKVGRSVARWRVAGGRIYALAFT